MRGLQNLRVIVAGGATGVGNALVRRLTDEGAKVVVGDINITGINELAKELASSAPSSSSNPTIRNHPVTPVAFDLADPSGAATLIQACVSTHGGVDALVNMGVASNLAAKDVEVKEMDADLWAGTLRTNLTGFGLTTRAVLPHFLAQSTGGAIVNVSSIAAWTPYARFPAYAASKAGLHALTRHTAFTYGKNGVRANAVAFGLIGTKAALKGAGEERLKLAKEAISLKRIGRPEEPAALVAYLLSEDASFVSGQVWSCCGGEMFRG